MFHENVQKYMSYTYFQMQLGEKVMPLTKLGHH